MKETPVPVIGITTYGRDGQGRFHLPGEYVDALRAAGGLPLLLPPGERNTAAILNSIDGLVLSGGGDIDPQLYGGPNHPSIERVDRERDALESTLARAVLQRRTPVLGICRGQQMLNIATGGTLITHLPELVGTAVLHRKDKGQECQHAVEIDPRSRLGKIVQTSVLPTVSEHHQGIGKVSPEWKIVARAADGVIEAQEHRHHPWMIAVQWHPELSYSDPRHLRLFQALVEAARKNRSRIKKFYDVQY